MKNIFHRKKGFTLVEMLVTISIVTLLSGVGFAAFVSHSRTQAVEQAANDLKEGVKKAKFNTVSFIKPDVSGCPNPFTGYHMHFCVASKASCSNIYDFEVDSQYSYTDAACSLPVYRYKLPQNVSYGAGSTCRDIRIASISNLTNGTTLPCQIVVSAYGITKTLSIDSSLNVSIN